MSTPAEGDKMEIGGYCYEYTYWRRQNGDWWPIYEAYNFPLRIRKLSWMRNIENIVVNVIQNFWYILVNNINCLLLFKKSENKMGSDG